MAPETVPRQTWCETGLLAGQAALNSLVAVEALKYSWAGSGHSRETASPHFFQERPEHATAAWAVAGVIGHEYPARRRSCWPGLAGEKVTAYPGRQIFSRGCFCRSIVVASSPSRFTAIIINSGASEAIRGAQPLVTCSAAMDSRHHRIKDRLCRRIAGCIRRWIAWLGFFWTDSDSAFADASWTRGMRAVVEPSGKSPWHTRCMKRLAGIVAALQREFRPEMEGSDNGGRSVSRGACALTGYISAFPSSGYQFPARRSTIWTSVWRRLEQHNGIFDVCHERPLGGLFPWRVAELLWFAGITPDGPCPAASVEDGRLLNGFASRQGQCRQTRGALPLATEITHPAASRGRHRKSRYVVPAFAIRTSKIVDLRLRKMIAVADGNARNVTSAAIHRLHTERSSPAVVSALPLRTKLAVERGEISAASFTMRLV